jgi:hypothetical protein
MKIDFSYFRRRAFFLMVFVAFFTLGALRYMWGLLP